MPAPISPDLRIRAVESVLSGENSYEEAASQFSVGRASISRWLSQYRRTGSLEPLPMGGSVSKIDDDAREVLSWLAYSHPDATLAELLELLKHEIGLETNDSTLSRVLKEMGLTRKKRGSGTRVAKTRT